MESSCVRQTDIPGTSRLFADLIYRFDRVSDLYPHCPNDGEALAAATQFLVQGSLQQWLGDLIEVNEVDVQNEDSTLRITVQYIIRRTQQQQTAQFTRGGTI